jgi:hypothetical protein
MVLVRCKWECGGDDLKSGMTVEACNVGISGCAFIWSLSLGTAAQRVSKSARLLDVDEKKVAARLNLLATL